MGVQHGSSRTQVQPGGEGRSFIVRMDDVGAFVPSLSCKQEEFVGWVHWDCRRTSYTSSYDLARL